MGKEVLLSEVITRHRYPRSRTLAHRGFWWPGWDLSTKTHLSGFALEAQKSRAGRDPRDTQPFNQPHLQKTETQREEGTWPSSLSQGGDPGPLPPSWIQGTEATILQAPTFFLSSSFCTQLGIVSFLLSAVLGSSLRGRSGRGRHAGRSACRGQDDLLREAEGASGSGTGPGLDASPRAHWCSVEGKSGQMRPLPPTEVCEL